MTLYNWLYTIDYIQYDYIDYIVKVYNDYIVIWLYTIDYIVKWLYTIDFTIVYIPNDNIQMNIVDYIQLIYTNRQLKIEELSGPFWGPFEDEGTFEDHSMRTFDWGHW